MDIHHPGAQAKETLFYILCVFFNIIDILEASKAWSFSQLIVKFVFNCDPQEVHRSDDILLLSLFYHLK